MRGKEVSRLEAFSDILFGFAMTLLVVALEVPENFDGLLKAIEGFPAFAATFTVAVWLWHSHYRFFRTFAMDDGVTIAINSALMFVVLFYVYPLKFVFTGMLGVGNALDQMTGEQGRYLMYVYDAGFIAIFALMTMLYLNGVRMREQYRFDALEVFDLKAGARMHLLSMGFGVVSFALAAVVPVNLLWVPGMFFLAMGPAHWINGVIVARKRRELLPAQAPG